ncbi:(2Fe-2S) ferredoxin domain-containing protein [Candidatus Peregrinibacteria bacterium]|nr:(2Fe-2S) ferredoxin domain-containing protein [Candidatus Peregrinibacteria bacterium]
MKYLIRICGGPRCKENFSEDLFKEAQKLIAGREDIELEKRGCMALCHVGPNIEVINLETNDTKVHNKVVQSEVKGIIDSL